MRQSSKIANPFMRIYVNELEDRSIHCVVGRLFRDSVDFPARILRMKHYFPRRRESFGKIEIAAESVLSRGFILIPSFPSRKYLTNGCIIILFGARSFYRGSDIVI